MKPCALNLETILASINLGLIVVDAQENILLWNEWIARHSGIPADLAIGKKISDAFKEAPSVSLMAALRSTLQYGLPAVLSNALHRSPLPLYTLFDTSDLRMHQSISITAIDATELGSDSDDCHQRYALIQVSDSSTSIKREKILRLHSEILKREATTDSMTGLYNRRFFDEHFKMALGQATRQKLPLSIFMVDIDYFKDYNDFYGHPAGDKALISVANTLKTQLSRSSDVVARYGGEEFILMLPNMPQDHALGFAEKIRMAVSDLAIPHQKSKVSAHISVSIGVSTFDDESNCQGQTLILAADTALYQSKRNGRNQVSYIPTNSFIVAEEGTIFAN